MVAIWDVERRTEIADRGEELMGVIWMTAHDFCLLIGEGTGFEHDAIRYRELAHVVEECPAADVDEVGIAQAHRVRLAHAMGLRDADLVHIRRGALLHDMGKLAVPDSIMLKPSALTDEQAEIMHRHPDYAHELLSPIGYLRPALDIPYCHHEKWDGTGYPRGLKGEEIPLAARIFAAVDVWDALRSDRPYRAAWTEERAKAYIQEQAGIHFDPKVVTAFLKMLETPQPVTV